MSSWLRMCFPILLALLGGASFGPTAAARDGAEQGEAAEVAARHPVLMISIDGLRPDAVLHADEYGLRIPTLRSFLAQGSYARNVINVNPTVTNPNHTSLVTGVLPREHGIYNNRPFEPSASLPRSYSLYSQIRAPTLWKAAKGQELKTGSIFWPVTADAGDIDFNLREGSDEDDEKIGDDAITLMLRERLDLLTVHFVSLDHQAHEFGPFSPEANAALERIDAVVGRMIADVRKARPDIVILVVSDHGFDRVTHQVNLNSVLVGAGFITMSADPEPSVASWKAFAWYVGGMAMMVLNDPGDQQARQELHAFLLQLAGDPNYGIERIYSREELTGAGLASEAEFVVAFKPGYRMGNAFAGPAVVASAGGAHGGFSTQTERPDMHASFFIAGPGIAAGRNLGTIEMLRIAPTIAEILKMPLPSARSSPLALGE